MMHPGEKHAFLAAFSSLGLVAKLGILKSNGTATRQNHFRHFSSWVDSKIVMRQNVFHPKLQLCSVFIYGCSSCVYDSPFTAYYNTVLRRLHLPNPLNNYELKPVSCHARTLNNMCIRLDYTSAPDVIIYRLFVFMFRIAKLLILQNRE